MSAASAAEDEVRALRAGVALIAGDGVAYLELRGADRHRFLNGLVTCDVKSLAVGASVYGFFTGPKGMVLADATLLALADRLLVELPAETRDAIAAHLARYVVADRVEIAPAALASLAVVAPSYAELAAFAATSSAPWLATAAGDAMGAAPAAQELAPGAWAFRRAVAGLAAVQVWGEPGAVAAQGDALAAVGARRVGAAAVALVRIENGVARHGVDFGPDTLPQETGRDAEAVSYTKGCYLGQEIVARIHYRGGVQRGMRGLRFDGGPPPPGTPLTFEGKESGRVGSGAVSALHGPIALALVHQRAHGPGVRVEAGGRAAEVVELPFTCR